MHLISVDNHNPKYTYKPTKTKTDPIRTQYFEISEVEGNLLDIETKHTEYIHINPAKFTVF